MIGISEVLIKLSLDDRKQVIKFTEIVKNYLKMKRIENEHRQTQ